MKVKELRYKIITYCHNCIHASIPYKINNLTHISCDNPKEFNQEKADNNEFSPWDQVRVFSDTCEDHEFKPLKTDKNDKFHSC